ncbi:baseplate J/gp47 family protein [Chitinivorax sp. PXF-14]|uniref:baseplate J/gp47 family protein n=1 Tax=Chitinivorax sp. PXF-14 TaxID=3230488 RepID=UPI00346509DC
MALTVPDYSIIRDAILRDIASQLPGANVALDGDYAVRANATAAAVEGLYQHQQWLARQILPDTADSDYLERHASLRGLTRKPAVAASGSIVFSGTAGSSVPLGTEAKTVAGVAYLTTVSGTIGAAGTVSLAASASIAGAAGNQPAATALTLTAAPVGVLSAASIASMSGGGDIEADAALLARLLFMLRNPPCGGAAHDYYSWAMSVAGVGAAYVYPNRRGLGTVDVIVQATAGGMPGAPLLASVQTYLDSVRPVQGDCLVLAPTAVPVAITATLTLQPGAVSGTVQAAVTTALAAYFNGLKPGDTVYLSRIRALISDTAGVLDFSLTAPGANVTTLVDATHSQLATLGAVTLS